VSPLFEGQSAHGGLYPRGAEISRDAHFCPSCGAPVAAERPTEERNADDPGDALRCKACTGCGCDQCPRPDCAEV